jgi:hypothetical protein
MLRTVLVPKSLFPVGEGGSGSDLVLDDLKDPGRHEFAYWCRAILVRLQARFKPSMHLMKAFF